MTPLKRNYLLPGAIVTTAEPMEISTILGSCVAVAMTDPKKKISGLCHYLLSRLADAPGPIARYGDQAIPVMIDQLKALGANPRDLIAKVYGGANVLGNVSIGLDVAQKNIKIAHELLESQNIPIITEDTGGTRGRKLLLTTHNFDVQQSFMGKVPSPTIMTPIKTLLRALIVDPSPLAHGNFPKILGQTGLTVVRTASDLFDAHHSLVNDRPDIVIFGLPNKSRTELQLIKDLKKMANLPPFFVYSLGGTGLSATQSLDLGARDFVHCSTSFDLSQLKALATLLTEKIMENNLVRKI